MNWKQILISPSETIATAIGVLNSTSMRILLVVDKERRLLGTITDGDIRRALIKKFDENITISNVMTKEPSTVSKGESRESIYGLMHKHDLLQIPVVDEERRVVGLEFLQDLFNESRIENAVLLMAGGYGRRLYPLTRDIPKPLLSLEDKPILEAILEQLVEFGFQRFFVSTHYKGEMIRDYFGDGSAWNVDIRYLDESVPLGTAGALGSLPDEVLDRSILVMNGDVITKLNFHRLFEFHHAQGGDATICVREYDFQVPYGVVEINEYRAARIIEKPLYRSFVNAGIYVLQPDVVKSVATGMQTDMPELLGSLIDSGSQVNIFPVHEYWRDIGQKEMYEQVRLEEKQWRF